MTTHTPTTNGTFTNEEVAALMARSHNATSLAEREAVLDELIALYQAQEAVDAPAAQEIRQAFVLALHGAPDRLSGDRFSEFLSEEIRPDDFSNIEWESPQQVLVFCELLYSFQFPDGPVASRVQRHVRTLLRQALQAFEQQGEMEKVLELVRLAPTTPDILRDGEILRLRNRAHLYEIRRVKRNRRFLFGFLVLQLLFITLVFPLLFINAENGAIQEMIEQTAEVDLPEEPVQQRLSYRDGLYWSLITATSIGYGDVTPMTKMGRVIAVTLGVMGVITTGLLAGLILSWIVPRPLD